MPTLKKNVKPQMPLLNTIRYTKYQYQFDQLYMYIYNFIYSSICFRWYKQKLGEQSTKYKNNATYVCMYCRTLKCLKFCKYWIIVLNYSAKTKTSNTFAKPIFSLHKWYKTRKNICHENCLLSNKNIYIKKWSWFIKFFIEFQ